MRALADLLIGGADRDAVAVLAALGLRTLQGLLRVVDDPGIDDSSLYEPPRDRYSEMADQAPDTFDLG